MVGSSAAAGWLKGEVRGWPGRYVRVLCHGQLACTGVQKNTLNPHWAEILAVNIFDPRQTLHLHKLKIPDQMQVSAVCVRAPVALCAVCPRFAVLLLAVLSLVGVDAEWLGHGSCVALTLCVVLASTQVQLCSWKSTGKDEFIGTVLFSAGELCGGLDAKGVGEGWYDVQKERKTGGMEAVKVPPSCPLTASTLTQPMPHSTQTQLRALVNLIRHGLRPCPHSTSTLSDCSSRVVFGAFVVVCCKRR